MWRLALIAWRSDADVTTKSAFFTFFRLLHHDVIYGVSWDFVRLRETH